MIKIFLSLFLIISTPVLADNSTQRSPNTVVNAFLSTYLSQNVMFQNYFQTKFAVLSRFLSVETIAKLKQIEENNSSLSDGACVAADLILPVQEIPKGYQVSSTTLQADTAMVSFRLIWENAKTSMFVIKLQRKDLRWVITDIMYPNNQGSLQKSLQNCDK